MQLTIGQKVAYPNQGICLVEGTKTCTIASCVMEGFTLRVLSDHSTIFVPTANAESDEDNWLLTDAGFNILLSMETYKWYYHLISAERSFDEHTFPYKVAGPLCDGGDVYFDIEGEGRLPEHRLLPPDVQPGEILALLNCGAYSLAQASQYNGRFLPAVILIRENGF